MAMLTNLDLMRRVPLFARLTVAQAEALSSAVVKRRYKRGEVLVAQGVEVDDIVIVAGQNRLQPGGRVRINQDSSASAMVKTVGTLADPTSAAMAQ